MADDTQRNDEKEQMDRERIRGRLLPDREILSLFDMTGGGLAGEGLLEGFSGDAGGVASPQPADGGGTADTMVDAAENLREVADTDTDSSSDATVTDENVSKDVNQSDSASSQT